LTAAVLRGTDRRNESMRSPGWRDQSLDRESGLGRHRPSDAALVWPSLTVAPCDPSAQLDQVRAFHRLAAMFFAGYSTPVNNCIPARWATIRSSIPRCRLLDVRVGGNNALVGTSSGSRRDSQGEMRMFTTGSAQQAKAMQAPSSATPPADTSGASVAASDSEYDRGYRDGVSGKPCTPKSMRYLEGFAKGREVAKLSTGFPTPQSK
jgi:hypothetical protein